MKKKSSKTCASKGCRKKALAGDVVCAAHKTADLQAAFPIDGITKMTEVERLTLVKIETECVNLILQIRNGDLELEEAKRKFQADMTARNAHRTQLMALAEVRKNSQQQLVQEIATKYGLDPQQMVYDPETGVLRDLRQENQGS